MRLKRNGRYLLIGALLSVFLLLFVYLFKNPTFQAVLPLRDWLGSPLFMVVFFMIHTLLFFGVSSSYEIIDLRLPGSRTFKAIFFSLSQAILMILYISEPKPHLLGTDYFLNIAKLLLLFMVQAFAIKTWLGTEHHQSARRPFIYWRATLVYALSFITFRWIAYSAIHIYAEPEEHLAVSYIWATLMGSAIGFVFCMIQRFLSKQQKFPKAVQFTGRFFFPLCLSFHLFFGMIYQISWSDVLARIILDTLAVFVASLIVMQWQIDEMNTDELTYPEEKFKHSNC
ncbi:hypothetical protein [Aerococcus vaginalis]